MAEPYTMPSAPHLHPSSASNPATDGSRKKRQWKTRLSFISSPVSAVQDSDETLARGVSSAPSEELAILDAPTASTFTMKSVGGNFGEDVSDQSGTGDIERPQLSERLDADDSTERGEAGNMTAGDLHRRSSIRSGSKGQSGNKYELQQPHRGSGGFSHRSQSRNARK
ncbi:MAG: hypothetical protein Q9166_005731 [cf. Caloplaca sp. 2 TL-2023]